MGGWVGGWIDQRGDVPFDAPTLASSSSSFEPSSFPLPNPTHQPTHLPQTQVQPLDMKCTFHIGGPPTSSQIGKRVFQDTMTWNDQGYVLLLLPTHRVVHPHTYST